MKELRTNGLGAGGRQSPFGFSPHFRPQAGRVLGHDAAMQFALERQERPAGAGTVHGPAFGPSGVGAGQVAPFRCGALFVFHGPVGAKVGGVRGFLNGKSISFGAPRLKICPLPHPVVLRHSRFPSMPKPLDALAAAVIQTFLVDAQVGHQHGQRTEWIKAACPYFQAIQQQSRGRRQARKGNGVAKSPSALALPASGAGKDARAPGIFSLPPPAALRPSSPATPARTCRTPPWAGRGTGRAFRPAGGSAAGARLGR